MTKNTWLTLIVICASITLIFKCIINYIDIQKQNLELAELSKTTTTPPHNFNVLNELGSLTKTPTRILITPKLPFDKTVETLYYMLRKTSLPIKKITLSPLKNTLEIETQPNE